MEMRSKFKDSSERLEKPGIKLTIAGLQGEWLSHYHYAAEASTDVVILCIMLL